jgi:high-affinity Fe2+/Pb2+ permease
MQETGTMYETKISTPRWIAYDIPGNIGWILYLIGFGKLIVNHGFSEHWLTSILLSIPVLLIVIGIAEMISERIAKLDRTLPAVRLGRGFGALTLAGLLGAILSLLTMKSNLNTTNAVMMIAGGILCFVFAGLLLIGYKRKEM